MGRDLAENIPAARAAFDEADRALGFGLSDLCFNGPDEDLQLTANTQPAILTASVAAFRALSDHHPYSAADVAELTAWARDAGAHLALTTQKDLVKLRASSLGSIPLRALKIGLEIMTGESVLDDALSKVLTT